MWYERTDAMDLYDIWIDGTGEIHKISEMDDTYIQNCLHQLYKWDSNWGEVTLDNLTSVEKRQIFDVGMKAWFVVNGQRYIDVLENELSNRE